MRRLILLSLLGAAATAFRRRLAALVERDAWWTVDAPDDVYTSVWREYDETITIHFLNASGTAPKIGENLAFEAPETAFAPLVHDIRFTVPEDESAVAVSPDFHGERRLKAERAPDRSLTVTLPKELLRIYTLVRIVK